MHSLSETFIKTLYYLGLILLVSNAMAHLVQFTRLKEVGAKARHVFYVFASGFLNVTVGIILYLSMGVFVVLLSAYSSTDRSTDGLILVGAILLSIPIFMIVVFTSILKYSTDSKILSNLIIIFDFALMFIFGLLFFL